MNRRRFITATALTTAASPTLLTLEGCSFGSTMSNLARYLPIGLQALAGVANLISPGAGTAVASLIGLINVAWGGLQAAVNGYNSAPAASKQTALEKVLVALDAVQAQIAQTTQALGVANDTAVKAAEAALLLITTTLGSIEAQMAPQAAPVVAQTHAAHAQVRSVASVASAGTTIHITGAPKDFKSSFNTIVQGAGRPDLKL